MERFGHALVQLGEPRSHVTLALLGVLVLRVFGKIAMGARNFDFFRQFVVELVLQGGDFVLELFLNFLCKINHLKRLSTAEIKTTLFYCSAGWLKRPEIIEDFPKRAAIGQGPARVSLRRPAHSQRRQTAWKHVA